MAIKLLISGGLGNQLAQYSAARALSLRRGTDLIIDTRFYRNPTTETSKAFWLGRFPIQAHVVTYDNARISAHHPLRRIYRRFISEPPARRFVERGLGLNPEFFSLEDGVTISGAFQHSEYFLKDFDRFNAEIDLLNAGVIQPTKTIDDVQITDYIGVHVRRGDYLSPEHVSSFDVLQRDRYYPEALSLISRMTGKRNLLIFSDDIEWCRSRPYFKDAVFRESSITAPPYDDLFLLSQCGALVIANSSFSWWAAMFASRRGVPVAAPSTWLSGLPTAAIGLALAGWVLI